MSFFIPKAVEKRGDFNDEVVMYIETLSNLASAFIQKLRNRQDALQYEAEYKLAQEKFKELINQLNDIVWIANGDGSEIVDLNDSFGKIYGYSSDEFNKDKNFWLKIVYDEDKQIAKESANTLLKNGNSEAVYRIVRSDGEIRWLRDRKSIIYDQKGNAIHMGGKATDITQQKHLEELLHIKNFALEASPTALGLSDMNGILFYANDAYVKLWGYKNKEEIIGKHVSEFASSKEQVGDVLNTIKRGEIYTGEGESTRIDGTKFISLISARIIKSPGGKPICMMALFVDITERKQFEIKLAEQNIKLEELISTKDKLFSIIAHDLKSPFNSILGLSDILASDYYEMSDKERIRIINLFYTSSKSAFDLLENLLDWARIQRGKINIHKESLNVKELVNESIKPYKLGAIKKQITIKNTIPNNLSISADKNTMRTVIGNIFDNAIKYSYSNGIINFSAQQESNNIKIEIRDNGLGMDELKLNNLFKLDKSQSTPGTENERGTGLGLIVCKEFISKNDGLISVDSEIGKGSSFIITIPESII
jgi:PAS domain S-box-containing protein